MSISQKEARRLAVAYQAYCESHSSRRYSGVLVWARVLDDAQEKTGVLLVSGLRKEIENLKQDAARCKKFTGAVAGS